MSGGSLPSAGNRKENECVAGVCLRQGTAKRVNVWRESAFGREPRKSEEKKDTEQSLQPDNPIVTILANRFARSRKNRANYGLQVKRMFSGPCGR